MAVRLSAAIFPQRNLVSSIIRPVFRLLPKFHPLTLNDSPHLGEVPWAVRILFARTLIDDELGTRLGQQELLR